MGCSPWCHKELDTTWQLNNNMKQHLPMLVVMSGQTAGDFSSSLFLLAPVSMHWACAARKSLWSLTHSSILAWQISQRSLGGYNPRDRKESDMTEPKQMP